MNYVLYGEEQYLLQQSLRKILRSSIPEGEERDTITYDALKSDVHALLEDAQTIPFFTEKKVILIQNANFLSTSDDTGWHMPSLEAYLDSPLESTILIFIGAFEKLDARKKIVKKVQKVCKVLQFRKIDESGKKSYVQELVTTQNLPIDSRTLNVLVQRLPLDIRSIRNEIEKLALYGEPITQQVVEELVTRPLEDDVFALVNAVVEKNLKKAFHLWEDMCVLNKDAIYLIATLASQFRFLFQVKELMMEGKYKEDIISILHAHPYRVQVSMKSVQQLQLQDLLSILSRLADLDQQIKAGKIDKILGFELFLISIQGGVA